MITTRKKWYSITVLAVLSVILSINCIIDYFVIENIKGAEVGLTNSGFNQFSLVILLLVNIILINGYAYFFYDIFRELKNSKLKNLLSSLCFSGIIINFIRSRVFFTFSYSGAMLLMIDRLLLIYSSITMLIFTSYVLIQGLKKRDYYKLFFNPLLLIILFIIISYYFELGLLRRYPLSLSYIIFYCVHIYRSLFYKNKTNRIEK